MKLEGQSAIVIRFVLKYKSVPDGFIVTRFFMRHCMFDTIPVGIAVQGERADELQEDMWVRVRGTFRISEENASPIIMATSIEEIRQPETPYLYPQTQ